MPWTIFFLWRAALSLSHHVPLSVRLSNDISTVYLLKKRTLFWLVCPSLSLFLWLVTLNTFIFMKLYTKLLFFLISGFFLSFLSSHVRSLTTLVLPLVYTYYNNCIIFLYFVTKIAFVHFASFFFWIISLSWRE